eukprot:s3195_g3.t1
MLHAPPLKTRKMLELPAPEPEVKKEPPAKAKAQASKLYKARPKIEPWILFLATCTVSSSSYEYYSESEDTPPPSAKDIMKRFRSELGDVDLSSDEEEKLIEIPDHE